MTRTNMTGVENNFEYVTRSIKLLEADGSKQWTVGQLCKVVGMNAFAPANRTYLKQKLIDTLGNKLYICRGKLSLPKLKSNRANAVKFVLPDDLWRGWVNPDNKIVPPRLGLDVIEVKHESDSDTDSD